MGTDPAQPAHLGDPLHARESILSSPQSWPRQQVWCVSYSKKNRFHLLSQLSCNDQAWGCLADRIISFAPYYPFSSYSALFGPPFPFPANKQLIPNYFFRIGPTFAVSIHKFRLAFFFLVSPVISAFCGISDVHCCPCKMPPSEGSQHSPLISHEVQPTFR